MNSSARWTKIYQKIISETNFHFKKELYTIILYYLTSVIHNMKIEFTKPRILIKAFSLYTM